MDYLREINAFERWLETNYLPRLSQLLWYRLMALCNRAGWPEWMALDNQRLMGLVQSRREATFVSIRDSLEEAGFLQLESGKKGSPNRYKMVPYAQRPAAKAEAKTEAYTEAQSEAHTGAHTEVQSEAHTDVHTEVQSEAYTEVQSEAYTEVQTADISSYPTDTQKTKTKTKTNTKRGPPASPPVLTVGELGNVRLTREELDRLRADYPDADEAVDWFSLYVADKGYKCKSDTHNLAIRRWALTAYREHRGRDERAPASRDGEERDIYGGLEEYL